MPCQSSTPSSLCSPRRNGRSGTSASGASECSSLPRRPRPKRVARRMRTAGPRRSSGNPRTRLPDTVGRTPFENVASPEWRISSRSRQCAAPGDLTTELRRPALRRTPRTLEGRRHRAGSGRRRNGCTRRHTPHPRRPHAAASWRLYAELRAMNHASNDAGSATSRQSRAHSSISSSPRHSSAHHSQTSVASLQFSTHARCSSLRWPTSDTVSDWDMA